MKRSLLVFQNFLSIILFVLLLTSPVEAVTFYVKQGGSGTGSGVSWTDASGDLQAMIDAAGIGDEVWVAAGTYKPTSGTDRNISFVMKNGVAILGGFPNTGTPGIGDRDWEAHKSILSGDIGVPGNQGDNSHHVISNSNLDNTAILDGVFVSFGNTSNVNPFWYGGGMYNISSSPTVINCTFNGNNAFAFGGGVYNDPNSVPLISQCKFFSNTAYSGGGIFNDRTGIDIDACHFAGNVADNLGGAIFNLENPTNISNCTFDQNSANGSANGFGGGAIHENSLLGSSIINCEFICNSAPVGGAIDFETIAAGVGTCEIINCTFTGNKANLGGGAIHSNTSGVTQFSDCIFKDNFTDNAQGIGTGGAYQSSDGGTTSSFVNCLFDNNKALGTSDDGGGAIMLYGGSVSLVNSTLVNNESATQGGAISFFQFGATPPDIDIDNCIFWNNQAPVDPTIHSLPGATATIDFSLIENVACPANVTCGASMIYNQDPLFVNPAVCNYRLLPCSPALNVGDNGQVPAGTTTDLDGDPRIFNTTVDLGPYEYQDLPGDMDMDMDGFSVCDGDCDDGDGNVYPGATEVCDGIDNDCDGLIDEDDICCPNGMIVFVNDSATGLNDGSSWADAFTDLQDALNSPCVTEIWVAEGIYRPTSTVNRTISFHLRNGVSVLGGFPDTGNPGLAERDWTSYQSILSGDLMGNDGQQPIVTSAATNTNTLDNSYTVVEASGNDATAIFDGFTITAGTADLDAPYPSRSARGGGLYIFGGSPTINNCNISGNGANLGGGIYLANSSFLEMTGCTINGNAAGNSGGMFAGSLSTFNLTGCNFTGNFASNNGGGLTYNDGAVISTLNNCFFTNNTASINGGAIISFSSNLSVIECTFTNNSSNISGGAVSVQSSAPTFTGCTFEQNSSNGNYAGGAIINVSSSTIISDCIFNNNTGGVRGGAITNTLGGKPVITGCSFTDNGAQFGGAIFNNAADCQIEKCSFIGNHTIGAGSGGAMYIYQSFQTTITNSIFYNNISDQDPNSGAGAIGAQETNAVFTNCTFSENESPYGAAFVNFNPGTNPVLNNCILFNNPTTNGSSILNATNFPGGTGTLNHCIIDEAACPTGVNCGPETIFNGDPLFIGGGDLHLQDCSPAIDSGTDAGAPMDDFDGNPRPVDAAPNIAGNYDMGAYEFQGSTPDPTPICTSNLTVQLDMNQEVTVTAEQLGINSTGCGDISFLINGMSSLTFDCDGVGLQTVTLQVTDERFLNTASTSCSFTVADDNYPCCDPILIPGVVTDEQGPFFEDGEIDITPSDGMEPYQFLWSNGAVTEDVAGLEGNMTYTVTVTDDRGCEGTASFIVGQGTIFNQEFCITAFPMGLFNPLTSSPSNRLHTLLNTGGLIPTQQPFNTAPWFYPGLEDLGGPPPPDMSDWALIVIRDAASPALAIERHAVVLHSDGTLTTVAGGNPSFLMDLNESYYIEIVHRNHLSISTPLPISPVGGIPICHNFTTGQNQAYVATMPPQDDDPMVEMFSTSGTFYGMVAGNAQNGDCQIDASDVNMVLGNYNQTFLTTVPWDTNCDGVIDANDLNVLFFGYNRNCHKPY